jgi:phosphoglycolate phosphatase
MIRHVIWDWNGTLLDDVNGCVDVLNVMLARRGLSEVTRTYYKERFGFPVRPFYEELGFDVSDQAFASLSDEFISQYKGVLGGVALHEGALDVICSLSELLESQLVVSAMEHTLLGSMLKQYGVLPHLLAHQGTRDLQAGSKVDVGMALVNALGMNPREVLLVGDTEHDCELAQAIGCACALHVGGHQSRERLQATGYDVVDSLRGVLTLVQRYSVAD